MRGLIKAVLLLFLFCVHVQNVRKKVLNTFPNTVLEDLNLGILSLTPIKACRKILFTPKPNVIFKKILHSLWQALNYKSNRISVRPLITEQETNASLPI